MRSLLVLLLTGCYAAHERPPMCTDEAAPTDLPHYGTVAILETITATGTGWSVVAGFDDSTLAQHDSEELPDVTFLARAGACVALGAGAHVATSEDGGDLTASVGGRVLAVSHAASTYHDASAAGLAPVGPGDVVQLTTSGGVVPPLAACVTMPGFPSSLVTQNRWRAGGPLVTTWDPAIDADWAELTLGAVVHDRIQLIVCDVPASAGRIEVPESMRSMVSSGSQLTVMIERTHVVAAGDFAVRAIAAIGTTGSLTVD